MKHKAVELDKYTEEDRKIDTVNIDFINSNAKSPGIIAKLNTSSSQKPANISYKMDTGSNSHILPFYTYKILFPRSTKKLFS